ncbi:hypothetical protein ACQJBY_015321 [Aegilops geniculata]
MPRAGHGPPSPHREAAAPCTGGGRSPAFPVGPGPRHHTPGDSGRASPRRCHGLRLRRGYRLRVQAAVLVRSALGAASAPEDVDMPRIGSRGRTKRQGAPTNRVLWSVGRLTTTFGSVIAPHAGAAVIQRVSV